MDTEQTAPVDVPVPVGTIYRDPSGGFRIVSSLTSPRDLTRVLVALTASMVEQLADPVREAPVAVVTEPPGMPTDADNAPPAEAS